MKLEYKGKKWEKEVAHAVKMKKSFDKINIDYGKKNLDAAFTKFQESGRNYLGLYRQLYGMYDAIACNHYILNQDAADLVQYEYLSGFSLLLAKHLFEIGLYPDDMDAEYAQKVIDNELDHALYKMIATGQTDNSSK